MSSPPAARIIGGITWVDIMRNVCLYGWIVLLIASGGCGFGKAKDLLSDYRSGAMVAADHGVLFYGQDVIAHPGQKVTLRAVICSPRSMDGIEGVEVAFALNGRHLGVSTTDGKGMALLSWVVPPQGYYRIQIQPISLPRNLDEDYKDALDARAGFLVTAREPDTPIIVVDLDHTVVAGGWVDVLTKDDPARMAHAAEVLNRLARKYQMVYLTQRPDFLTRKSQQWLASGRFPPGPVLPCDIRQSLKDNAKMKSVRISLIRSQYPNVQIGVGDQLTDAQAYLENGLTAYLIPHYENTPRGMRATARQIRTLPNSPKVQVVTNWEQIERGILQDERFEAQTFAAQLEQRADGTK